MYSVHLFCIRWFIYFRKFFFHKFDYFWNQVPILNYWFHCVDIFYIKFRFCETLTVISFVTRNLLIETLCKLRTSMCWFTLYLHMLCLGASVNSNVLYIPLYCVSHSIDICTIAIKVIRNLHPVSTNLIADILYFNDNIM